MKYNYYWRKSGLKKPYGDNFLSLVEEYKPKNVLEIGVFCGVTSRNICELLKTNFGSDFRYYGLDLFGSTKTSSVDEIEPKFLENQKFSNPLKTIYYNFIKKENLNSKISVQNFLKKFSQNIELIKGDTRVTLENVPLSESFLCLFLQIQLLKAYDYKLYRQLNPDSLFC